MKRCFIWDAAQPFVIAHLAGLLQLPSSRARQVFCSQIQTIQNTAACPVFNLPKFFLVVSPMLPTSLPHTSLPSSLPAGCRWLFTSNSKFWSWHSGLLRESHAHICRLWSICIRQHVLSYNRSLSFPLPVAATSSFHLALTHHPTAP